MKERILKKLQTLKEKLFGKDMEKWELIKIWLIGIAVFIGVVGVIWGMRVIANMQKQEDPTTAPTVTTMVPTEPTEPANPTVPTVPPTEATNPTEPMKPTEPTEPTVPTEPPHVHTWDDATCTTPKTCTECGATEGKALGHTWQNATCTNPQTCSVCETKDGTALDHDYSKVVTVPTCTAQGYTTYTCAGCGDQYQSDIVAALGHDYADAACEVPKTCTACGHSNGAALGHTWDNGVVIREATEDAEGEKLFTCEVCAETMTQAVPALDHVHSYTAVVTDPTCTEKGYTMYTCRCGDIYKMDEVAALGHKWNEATCKRPKTCTVCAQTEGALGNHQYMVTSSVEPTSTKDGFVTYTCKYCALTYTDILPAVGSAGLVYKDNGDGTCTVVGIGTCTDKHVVIPRYHNGSKVTTIAKRAFYNCSTFTEITIPDTVNNIGTQIFYKCSSLHTVYYNGTYGSRENPFLSEPSIKKVVFGGKYVPDEVCFRMTQSSGGPNAVEGKSYIEEVVILDGVTTIGSSAFEDCYSLISVVIPDSVDFIKDFAFEGCENLKEINLPAGITSIRRYVFSHCSSLVDVTIPEGVVTIGEGAFYHCENLTRIVIPEGVTSIGEDAFQGCNALTRIVIPEGVTSIGEDAFKDCNALTRIVIPESVTSIGSYAFFNCTAAVIENFSDLEFEFDSESHGYIARNAYIIVDKHGNRKYRNDTILETEDGFIFLFENGEYTLHFYVGEKEEIILPEYINGSTYTVRLFSSAKSVIIPHGITSIGGVWGSRMTTITIPDSVTSIDEFAFDNCDSLRFAKYGNCKYLGNPGNPYLVLMGFVDDSFKTYTIHNDTKMIAPRAFVNCSSMTSIVIPDSVTSIGDYAFNWCTGLTSVTIGNGVTSIGEYAFDMCNSLTTVTIGNGVIDIGDYAFRQCKSLISIVIPDSVTSIGDNILYNCSSVESITLPFLGNSASSNGRLQDFFGSAGIPATLKTVILLDTCNSIGDYAFVNVDKSNVVGCGLTSVVIPDSVTSIGKYAFYNCRGLTNVTIGNGVTSIGEYAFSGCGGLTNVTIGNGVTSIGDSAFQYCSSLVYNEYDNAKYLGNAENPYVVLMYAKDTTITSCLIHVNVKVIGEYAFRGCRSLTSITIPDGVTSIGRSAFNGCHRLTSITIPDSVTSIGDSAFQYCSSLVYNEYDNAKYLGNAENPYVVLMYAKDTTITSCLIHVNVKVVGEDAFRGCRSLTSITIPDGVTSIGGSAFSGCSSLTSVTIPDSVTSIGESAFENCTSLTSITVESGNPVYHSSGNCIIETASKTLVVGCKNSTIPTDGSVTSIGGSAFSGCSSLTSITIPDSVTSIGAHAFSGCTSLTSITFEGTVAQWNVITKLFLWDYNVPATEVVCSDGEVSL